MMTRRSLLLSLSAVGAASADTLDFLRGLSEFEDIRRMLPDFMKREGQRLVAERKASLRLDSADAVRRRREYVRERILAAIGGLPERTKLNPQHVGTIERDGYRIEKIIFESQPKLYVTANLYLPAGGTPPYPGVLYPLGHETGGKQNPTWQQMLATLARKGYLALTWDPVAQGERIQIYDADVQGSKLRGSTTEHTVMGTQCLLTGHHIARYTIWDGIRALDYLLSRKEVDRSRVICTGNSGGGTHTAYLSALDDRITIAAPSCYITSWHWMLKTLGPQDAEQVFPGWLADGLDYPDFLYAFAPKPYLMLSAIRDFFPIDGARESFAEVQRVYAAIGAEDKLRMFEADDGHGYTQPRRLAAYEWFSKWANVPAPATETPIQPETTATLNCTVSGQVASSLGGETVLTLNRAHAERLRQNRRADKAVAAAKTRSGFKLQSGPVPATPYGVIRTPEYAIEKFTYESEPGILIPSLLYVPSSGGGRAVILVDGAGKSATRKVAEQFASNGLAVLTIDLRGMGETAPKPDVNDSESYRMFGDYEDAMTGILIRRTLVAMRALDIIRGVDVLRARTGIDSSKLVAIGRNAGAVPLLYAAAFDRRIQSVALENMLVSYEAVATGRMHRFVFEHIVPGALIDYDLPDLVASLAPRTVWISDPQSPVGTPVPQSEVQTLYRSAQIRPSHPGDEYSRDYYKGLI